jgi:hypothetical protein
LFRSSLPSIPSKLSLSLSRLDYFLIRSITLNYLETNRNSFLLLPASPSHFNSTQSIDTRSARAQTPLAVQIESIMFRPMLAICYHREAARRLAINRHSVITSSLLRFAAFTSFEPERTYHLATTATTTTMDSETNQLMEALKKCFRNETVNEIINLHGKLSQRLTNGCDQQNKVHDHSTIDAPFVVGDCKKSNNFIDSMSVSYRFKQLYSRALSKLNLCATNSNVSRPLSPIYSRTNPRVAILIYFWLFFF